MCIHRQHRASGPVQTPPSHRPSFGSSSRATHFNSPAVAGVCSRSAIAPGQAAVSGRGQVPARGRGPLHNLFPPPAGGGAEGGGGSCSDKPYLVPAPAGPPQSLRDSSPCEGEQINQRPPRGRGRDNKALAGPHASNQVQFPSASDPVSVPPREQHTSIPPQLRGSARGWRLHLVRPTCRGRGRVPARGRGRENQPAARSGKPAGGGGASRWRGLLSLGRWRD